jgi:phage gp29-like protein
VEANIDEQIIKPLLDMNYDIVDGKYPQFRFKALTAEDKKNQFNSYLNGLNSKSLTKTREDENFFRKRLEMPLLPQDHPVAGEATTEPPARSLRLLRKK